MKTISKAARRIGALLFGEQKFVIAAGKDFINEQYIALSKPAGIEAVIRQYARMKAEGRTFYEGMPVVIRPTQCLMSEITYVNR